MFLNRKTQSRPIEPDPEPIEAPSKMRLHKDMTSADIINEMCGRTSGETRQEIQQIFKDDTIPNSQTQNMIERARKYLGEAMRTVPHLQVLDIGEVDGHVYALVRKGILTNAWPSESVHYSSRYFIVGINDEGFYFIHPLESYKGIVEYKTVKEMVDWMNRKHDGFVGRLQGDVLFKLIDASKWKVVLSTIKSNTDYGADGHELIYYNTQLRLYQDPNALRDLNEIDLGCHKIMCLGKITRETCYNHSYNDQLFSYWVIESDQVVLTHPEHEQVKMDIPKNHIMVIAPQDGRSARESRSQFE